MKNQADVNRNPPYTSPSATEKTEKHEAETRANRSQTYPSATKKRMYQQQTPTSSDTDCTEFTD